jgi:prophage regulatory protein
MNRLLRLPDVEAVTGLKHTTIYKKMAERDFPARVRLGVRAVGWLESDIERWIQERVAASRPAA